MKQEFVLPKFKVPGQPNWLMRGLWIGGGVVLLQLVVVGVVLWRYQARQNEAFQAALEQQRKMAAVATAPVHPATTPPSPAEPAEKSSAAPARAVSDTTMLANTAGAHPGADRASGKMAHGARRKGLRAGRGTAKSRVVTHATSKPRKAGRAGKPDPIDDILRKMK